ncbi:hypothetical protein FGU71_07055 [Erythrobacter insulae]|uniref:Sel1 repeat family protein n=1 Tax=Erythrobacter insulae TaxID=2584124 RepID=A0A547PBX9_9SPHN|nr:hypothetical protein [Erythrobacter insulae]TRD11646.1 hypothetical protein FGU71_07055 [Erythrobacter insulae]
MIARIIWQVFLLLAAAVTISLQLDRQSALVPALADAVPAPARGFAQAQLTARALQSGPPALAVTEARRLVEKRPIPAEPLRLLAQAQFAAGQNDAGFLTIQIAAKRGWRDPAAQESMLRLALAAGDEAEAAKRYIAMFLQNRTEDALLEEFGNALFGTAESEAARTLTEIVSGSDRWPETFLQRGARVLPPRSFVQIVRSAHASGAAFNCETLKAVAPRVTARDPEAGAMIDALVAGSCP